MKNQAAPARRLRLNVFATIAAGVVVACSMDSATTTASTKEAIQNGTETGTSYPFVVGVSLNNGQALCTGTLIAPNLVLTARHCVARTADGPVDCDTSRFGTGYAVSGFAVTTDPTFQTQRWYGVRQVLTPTDTRFCGNDIALMILSSNVPAAVATPAMPVVQHKSYNRSLYSNLITAVGYGATSPTGAGAGTRRIKKDIRIDCLDGSRTSCTPANLPYVQPAEMVTEPGTCEGDSGSGAFDNVGFANANYMVHGVLSRGGSDATDCLQAIYTRTDAYADWIQQAGITAASLGGYAAPGWTVDEAASPGDAPYVPRDAGADTGKNDAGAKDAGPPPAQIGESCADGISCASGDCVDLGNGEVCSASCSADAPCESGNYCATDGYCHEGTAPAAPTSAKSGCSVTPEASAPSGLFGAALAAFGMVLGRVAARRKRVG